VIAGAVLGIIMAVSGDVNISFSILSIIICTIGGGIIGNVIHGIVKLIMLIVAKSRK